MATAHFRAGDGWLQCQVTAQLPEAGDPAFRASMERVWCRIDLQADSGAFWIDDLSWRQAEIRDEWDAWQERGLDLHSIVADPLFADAAADDYRVTAESPALDLGFKPIRTDVIGPYQDDLRATWPVREMPGAREKLTAATGSD